MRTMENKECHLYFKKIVIFYMTDTFKPFTSSIAIDIINFIFQICLTIDVDT